MKKFMLFFGLICMYHSVFSLMVYAASFPDLRPVPYVRYVESIGNSVSFPYYVAIDRGSDYRDYVYFDTTAGLKVYCIDSACSHLVIPTYSYYETFNYSGSFIFGSDSGVYYYSSSGTNVNNFPIYMTTIANVISNVTIYAQDQITPVYTPINAQLTINIDPPTGGSVTDGGSINCTNATCQYPISQVSQSSLQATASSGYAFYGLIEKENPHPLTLNTSVSKEITAKFYKTFRNAATEGYRKLDGNTTGGWCLNYVESETDLPDDVCTYSAVNCMGQASAKGYATGNVPKVGAIVIYAQNDAMNNGHAAIVTNPDVGNSNMSVHDSNINGDGVVHDRTVSRSSASIMGYIYPIPQ